MKNIKQKNGYPLTSGTTPTLRKNVKIKTRTSRSSDIRAVLLQKLEVSHKAMCYIPFEAEFWGRNSGNCKNT